MSQWWNIKKSPYKVAIINFYEHGVYSHSLKNHLRCNIVDEYFPMGVKSTPRHVRLIRNLVKKAREFPSDPFQLVSGENLLSQIIQRNKPKILCKYTRWFLVGILYSIHSYQKINSIFSLAFGRGIKKI